MKKHRVKNIISLLLIAVLMMSALAACTAEDSNPTASDAGGDVTPSPSQDLQGTVQGASEGVSHDGRFTLPYDAAGTFNPLSGTNIYNMTAAQLAYENLYDITADFSAQSRFVSAVQFEALNVVLTIRSGIMLHDGTELTAQDVAYSINSARNSAKYSARFSDIAAVASEGELVMIALTAENIYFTQLLDIPVIKNGTASDDIPIGTGPYIIAAERGRLIAFSKHEHYASLPVDVIYLREASTEELADLFYSSAVDLVTDDPTYGNVLNIHIDCEHRTYDTTVLHYIGFNSRSAFLRDENMRNAISRAVNYESIISDVLGSAYFTAAPALFHPSWSEYDTAWETGTGYSHQRVTELFVAAGLADPDGTGFLQYPTEGGMTSINLDFIVNSESEEKVAAAKRIAEVLSGIGINITVRPLSWAEYQTALEEGDFDLYYAEVKITADFDFSEILSADGALNYGNVSSEECEELLSDYLSGSVGAAKRLSNYVRDNAPIITIAYEKHLVMTHRTAVSGVNPIPSGVFYNIQDWEITRS